MFLGMIQSVGGTSFATTVGDKTYFTYAQVRSRFTKGTPIHVGMYDHTTGDVTKHRAVFARPINNVHCTPALVIDSNGILHLVSGAHNRPFYYTHSVHPLDISAWTQSVKVLDSGYRTRTTDRDGVARQTYPSLVCGPHDTLHLVFRQKRRFGFGRFPWTAYYGLCYQTRPAGGEWSKARMLAYPAAGGGYTNFYQKLTADRDGRLYLSFNVYRSSDTPSFYRHLRLFRYRVVWWSDDGQYWQFATTESLARNATPLDPLIPSAAQATDFPLPSPSPTPSADPTHSVSPTTRGTPAPTVSPTPRTSPTTSPPSAESSSPPSMEDDNEP
jgi:hypothetical protein